LYRTSFQKERREIERGKKKGHKGEEENRRVFGGVHYMKTANLRGAVTRGQVPQTKKGDGKPQKKKNLRQSGVKQKTRRPIGGGPKDRQARRKEK